MGMWSKVTGMTDYFVFSLIRATEQTITNVSREHLNLV